MAGLIEELTYRAMTAQQQDKFFRRKALYDYLHKINDDVFKSDISKATRTDIWGTLQSVGLSLERQEIAASRYRELVSPKEV